MTRQFVKLAYDGPIATLTVARPDRLNALSPEVIGELLDAVSELARRAKELRCVVFTGEGKAFIAGADIAAMQRMTPAEANEFATRGHQLGSALEALPLPVIAAINGFALGGGCELALACDFAYASDKAKLGQPEVKLGVIPGFGGTQRLLRRVGVAMARELAYSGMMIDAQEALRIGLVNRVFPHDELLPTTLEAARAIAEMGPLAVSACKRVIREGEMMPLPQANRLEVEAFARLFQSADQKEGMAAFLAKRPAAFKGE
jgi:enoyl-CoA hydratase